MMHHATRLSRHIIFWSLLAVAVGLTGLRLVVAGVGRYQIELAEHIGQLIGAPVTIGHLSAKLRGFTPELILDDIAIQSPQPGQAPAVTLRQIRLGGDVLAMLMHREVLSSAWVTLVGAKFSVYRKDDGSFAIAGLQAGGGQPDWLWQGRRLELLQSEIVWHGQLNKQQPLILQAVDLTVINQGGQHRVRALAKLPKAYAHSLTMAADFIGNPFVSESLNGTAFLEAKQLKLAAPELKAWADRQGVTVVDGQTDARFWVRLEHSHLLAVSGTVAVQDVLLQRQHHPQWALDSLRTAFVWQQDAQTHAWHLDVPRLAIQDNGKTQAEGMFKLAGQHADKLEAQQLAVFIRQLDVRQALRTAQFFAPAAVAAQLPAEAKGTLGSLSLWVNLLEHRAAINGDFNEISFSPLATLPGLDNFSGHIQGTDRRGALQLATVNAHLSLPSLFREDLVIKRLQGQLAWQRQDTALSVSSPALAVDLLGLQSVSRMQLKVPLQAKALPFLDLQMALSCDDASQLKHYFPVGVMKPADIAWLDKAFVQGQVENGKLVFVGYLGQALASHIQDFEVADTINASKAAQVAAVHDAGEVLAREPLGGGFFEAMMDVKHLQLDYAPGWPQLTDISGQLRFLQGRMVVSGDEGYSQQLRASKVKVINEAIGVSDHLLVQGLVDGEISQALVFLKNSPLQSRMGAVADAISTKGVTQVSLDLSVPLAMGVQPKVKGTATLKQASLQVLALGLPVQRINGLLKFNEYGVYSDTIKAEVLKHPVNVTIANNDGQITLKAAGHAGLADLEQQFGLPHTAFANGALDYQLAFRLPLDDKPSEVVITSDLAGVQLQAPGLLSKSRHDRQAAKIVFGLGNKQAMPITVNYADTLKAALHFDTAQQRVVSGHIVLGEGAAVAPAPDQIGLKFDINRKTLDLQAVSAALAGGSGQSNGLVVHEATLYSDNARWGQAPLGAFYLHLQAHGQQWLGRIRNNFIVGDLSAPLVMTPDSTVHLNLSLLDLSVIKQLQKPSQPTPPPTEPTVATVISPQQVPLLAIHSDNTRWEKGELGGLALETQRLNDGIAIKTLRLDGLSQSLQMSGAWTDKNGRQQTQLRVHLDLPNTGQALSRLDISHDLVGSRATVDVAGHWPDAPQQFSLASLQGDIDLYVSEGRILSIEPGIGRMLGALAMAQWVKRLQLDFRDLYEEGLTFNFIKGHFGLANGKAETHNLLMDAIPAR
ncbi:MAG: DUF3971 domain-containing protein, partial [Methylovulum sp.]|nr:DUF3971 domain-containing protein [Methylovulum sp.]